MEAWEKCTGDPSIIVAVLDEGVMYTHPDLADNIWVNEKNSSLERLMKTETVIRETDTDTTSLPIQV